MTSEATTRQLTNELSILADLPTERVNRSYWFPLAIFGGLSLLFAAVISIWGDPETTNSWIVWAIGGPAGGIATSAYFARKSDEAGVMPRSPWVYPSIGVATTVTCFVIATTATPRWIYGGILIVVGIANMALGTFDRYAQIAIAGVGLTAIGLTAGIGAVESATVALISGAFMLVTAVFQKLLP